MFFYCYNEKDLKNGWLLGKKNFKPPSFVVGTALLLELFVLAHWAPPKRYILWKDRVVEGGVARVQVWTCCKPKRGYMVGRITLCCVFWHLSPCFACYLFSCHQCCKRITLARPLTTEQMFASLLTICWGTRWMC